MRERFEITSLYDPEIDPDIEIKKAPLGENGLVVLQGCSYERCMEIVAQKLQTSLHLHPRKGSFKVLSGFDGKIPGILVTDGYLLQTRAGYDFQSNAFSSLHLYFDTTKPQASYVLSVHEGKKLIVRLHSSLKLPALKHRVSHYPLLTPPTPHQS